MIVVNCALKQSEIIEIVENIKVNDENPFKYKEKKGIKMYFISNYSNGGEACTLIKTEIKKSNFGSALLFNVAEEA